MLFMNSSYYIYRTASMYLFVAVSETVKCKTLSQFLAYAIKHLNVHISKFKCEPTHKSVRCST